MWKYKMAFSDPYGSIWVANTRKHRLACGHRWQNTRKMKKSCAIRCFYVIRSHLPSQYLKPLYIFSQVKRDNSYHHLVSASLNAALTVLCCGPTLKKYHIFTHDRLQKGPTIAQVTEQTSLASNCNTLSDQRDTKYIFCWFCLITLIFLIVVEAELRQNQIRASSDECVGDTSSQVTALHRITNMARLLWLRETLINFVPFSDIL